MEQEDAMFANLVVLAGLTCKSGQLSWRELILDLWERANSGLLRAFVRMGFYSTLFARY